MVDNSKAIKEEYQKKIDNKIDNQLQEFKIQAKKVHDTKDRYLAQYSRLKKSRAELKEIKEIGKEENLDTTAYKYKIERDIDRQEEELRKSKQIADNHKKGLDVLVKKHKEEIKAMKQEMFNALEEERAKRKREKEIIGD